MNFFCRFLVVLSAVLLLRGVFCCGFAFAGEKKLTFGTQVRLRYEFQNNFNQLYYGDNPAKGAGDDGFLLGRFRAGFDYRPLEKVHFALWMQDSEVWGLALSNSAFYKGNFAMEHNPDKDRWELWKTYVKVKKLFDIPLSIKLGRQKIFYGDKRVFGPGEWGNTGRWIWDAAKLSFKFKSGFVDTYYGRTMMHDPDEFSLNHRHGFESAGFYSHFKIPSSFKIAVEPFFMTKSDDHDLYKGEDGQMGDVSSYYMGFRTYGKNIMGFDYDLTYIIQRGDYADDDIDAYGYHVLLAYNMEKIRIKPRISLEYSYASGDSNPDDNDHETFDGAFGARDKMYGRINLMHWKNLKDAQINLEIKPVKWLYIKTEFHKYWLAEKKDAWYLNPKIYRDKTGNSGDELGKEFDIVGRINLPKGNQVQLGFGHFWPDEFAEKKASDKESNWVFIQWQYKFSKDIF